MPFTNLFNIPSGAALIEFGGALLITSYILTSLIVLVRTQNITTARLLVADGIITGLSFKLAGTLLKTLELRSWQSILMFSAIFALRTILKRFFT